MANSNFDLQSGVTNPGFVAEEEREEEEEEKDRPPTPGRTRDNNNWESKDKKQVQGFHIEQVREIQEAVRAKISMLVPPKKVMFTLYFSFVCYIGAC